MASLHSGAPIAAPVEAVRFGSATRSRCFSPSSQYLSASLTMRSMFSLALVVGDLVLAARGLVGGHHVKNSVGVDVKRDFDLRNAARRRRNAGQFELVQQIAVLCS